MPQVGDGSDWDELLRSVSARRNRDARHLKPTCLLVVARGIGEGALDPDDIDSGVVTNAIAAALVLAGLPIPDRLWRPFWHLTNDGAWDFVGPGGRVGPEHFGPNRKPESLHAIATRTDRVSVTGRLRPGWLSAEARAGLEGRVIEMLRNDDANCRSVAAALSDDPPSRDADELRRGRPSGSQGRQADVAVRLAVERHAMAQAADHFSALGWNVADVSAVASHDLLCTRGNERLLVEVKGTAGFGRKVVLTANEVSLATTDADTALAVVSGIELVRSGNWVSGVGGELRILHPWNPAPADLRPLTFDYLVPRP